MKKSIFLACSTLSVLFFSCNKTPESTGSKRVLSKDILIEYQNEQNNSSESKMISLGRVLFYDEVLSANEKISCATCHQQSQAFADGKKFSEGFTSSLTKRNSPSITNMRNRFTFFWDAQSISLEEQVLIPITNHIEMGQATMEDVVQMVASRPYYSDLFEEAFGTNAVTESRISSALAKFVRSIASISSQFEVENNVTGGAGWGNITADQPLTDEGAKVFQTAGCAHCHSGMDFGGNQTANIGLDLVYEDPGKGGWSEEAAEVGTFKVPSLRNIELTAPYMHDGRFQTLEEVVEHYNSGVQPNNYLDWRLQEELDITEEDMLLQGFTMEDLDNAESPADLGITVKPKRLNLTEFEKAALVRFLKSLSDDSIQTNKDYTDPFILVETE